MLPAFSARVSRPLNAAYRVSTLRLGDAELIQQDLDRLADLADRQFANRGEQRCTLQILLAGEGGALVRAQRIQVASDLVFHHRPFFLDHQHGLAALREAGQTNGVHGPDQAGLVEPDAQSATRFLVQAEIGQRLAHIQIGLAGTDDGQAAALAIDHDAVDAIGPGKGGGSRQPVVDQPILFHQRGQVLPQVEALRRQPDIGGGDIGATGVRQLDAAGEVECVGDALESDVAAAVARHGPPEQPELDDLANGGGVEHRHHGGNQRVFRLVRAVGGFAAVIVAGDDQEAALRGGAFEVAELQGFAGAINADAFAVPQAENALECGFAEPVELLGAADGADRELFVEARPEHDMVLVEQFLCAPQRRVIDPERRAAIARDVACRFQPGGAVAPRLVERQPNQGLVRRKEDTPTRLQVLVVECGHRLGHRRPWSAAAIRGPEASRPGGSRSCPPSAGSR